MKFYSQRKKNGDARETIWRHEAKQGKTILDMPVDVEITLTPPILNRVNGGKK